MSRIDDRIAFPITMTWEDGSVQAFSNIGELECNLEDFDSSREPLCKLKDADGFLIRARISMTWIEILERIDGGEAYPETTANHRKP